MPEAEVTYKAVILLGGPSKDTRFSPLSLDQPMPLFAIGGRPLVLHHIAACASVPGMREILLIGYYPKELFHSFLEEQQREFGVKIRYLQEFAPLGTAGGLFHFRDQILAGEPAAFFVMNSDVCCDFPLVEMLQQYKQDTISIVCTEATRSESLHFGCAVVRSGSNEEFKEIEKIIHYVEKPSSFVSSLVNCGIYLMGRNVFQHLKAAVKQHKNQHYSFDLASECNECVQMETQVFKPLASQGCLYAFITHRFWSQVKTAGAAIYANRHMLQLYRKSSPELLAASSNEANSPKIIGDVFIDPTATVSSTAVLGPNVSIGKFANVGPGARVRESIIMQNVCIREHACVLMSIVGPSAIVGEWCRVEGTATDPNPNRPFAKIPVLPLFNEKGQLNPSCTVIGSQVTLPAELVVRNSIILPHKEVDRSYRNQIIL